jgi:hypothetical protein
MKYSVVQGLSFLLLVGCAANPATENIRVETFGSFHDSSESGTTVPLPVITSSRDFQPQSSSSESPTQLSDADLAARNRVAEETIKALKTRDMNLLADLANENGIRFTIGRYIGKDEDIALTPDQIRSAFADRTVRNWGYLDGSGKPMMKTFSDFFSFLYNDVYANTAEVKWNNPYSSFGPTLDEIRKEFGMASQTVEYRYPGKNPLQDGTDFTALKIVLLPESRGNSWNIAGFIRVYWSP